MSSWKYHLEEKKGEPRNVICRPRENESLGSQKTEILSKQSKDYFMGSLTDLE